MTDHKDLKRRIRARQHKTGESYTTARMHVLAQRDRDPVPVLEPIDVTELARPLGLTCSVLVERGLADRVERVGLVTAIRDALLATHDDPATARLRRTALLGLPEQRTAMAEYYRADLRDELRRFLARARAGIGGVSSSGTTLAFHACGELVLCMLWLRGRERVLLVTPVDSFAELR